MKREHRHELKTNELAEWLTNLPQWAKENRIMIIGLSIVAVATAGTYFWHRYTKNVVSVQRQVDFTGLIGQLPQRKWRIIQDQAQGFDSSYMLIPPADKLQTVAQTTKNDCMAALGFIKRAETLRAELHYRLGAVGKQDLTQQINQAMDSYIQAINLLSNADFQMPIENRKSQIANRKFKSPSLMAKAKLGLGLCEEELGNFDQAQKIYRDIIANPDFEGTVAIAAARQRLDTMTDYQQKVVFRKAPKPASTETLQPQIQIKPVRSKAPASTLPTAETSAVRHPADNGVKPPDINTPG